MDETGRLIETGAGPRPHAPPVGAHGRSGAGARSRAEDRSRADPPLSGAGRLTEAGTGPRPHAPLPGARPVDPLRRMRTKELVTEVARKAGQLARKEVELARVELRADLRSEIRMASGLGVAGLCAILGVQLLLTALVLGLMEAGLLPGWAAALIVAAVVFGVGAGVGLWGWGRRVRRPLDTTRRSLQEDVRWAKERMA
jgi:putative superfamily III holin-X